MAQAKSTNIFIAAFVTLTNAVVLWGISLYTHSDFGEVFSPYALLFIVSGLLLGATRLMYYVSIEMLGVARAVIANSTTPVFAAIGAVIFLREPVSLIVALGTLVVVAGVITVTLTKPWNDEHRVNLLGFLLALGSALVTAGTFLMWDLGLKHIQQTILATALTMTGMLAVLLPFPAFSGAGGRKCGDRDAVVNMLAAGLLTTAGFLAYFVALNNSTVSRIVPLVNTTPVFAVLILRLIFRRIEVVTAKTIIGATLTVLGVVLVVIG